MVKEAVEMKGENIGPQGNCFRLKCNCGSEREALEEAKRKYE